MEVLYVRTKVYKTIICGNTAGGEMYWLYRCIIVTEAKTRVYMWSPYSTYTSIKNLMRNATPLMLLGLVCIDDGVYR